MDIIISGLVTAIMQPQTGVSQKTGNAWMKQQYVIQHDQGQYPKYLMFEIFGEDSIKSMAIQPNEFITVHLNANASQSQKDGRWFNELRCWKVDRQQMGMQQGYQQQGYAPQGYQQPMQGGFPQQQPMMQQPMQGGYQQQPMQQQAQAPFPPAQGQAMPQQQVQQPAPFPPAQGQQAAPQAQQQVQQPAPQQGAQPQGQQLPFPPAQ